MLGHHEKMTNDNGTHNVDNNINNPSGTESHTNQRTIHLKETCIDTCNNDNSSDPLSQSSHICIFPDNNSIIEDDSPINDSEYGDTIGVSDGKKYDNVDDLLNDDDGSSYKCNACFDTKSCDNEYVHGYDNGYEASCDRLNQTFEN